VPCVRKKTSFQLLPTVYGKNNRVFSATTIADEKRAFNLDRQQGHLADGDHLQVCAFGIGRTCGRR
jgi:hypothetical protein